MKWTKFVGTVTAMLCGLSACVPFTAAAEGLFPEPDSLNTSYNSADINRSGSVDVTDSAILSQYLAGQRYVAQPWVMDTNFNGIISPVDQSGIVAKTAEESFVSHVEGCNVNFGLYSTSYVYTPSGQSISRQFVRHRLSDGTGTSNDTTYTLSMTEASFPTGISEPDFVIGSNDFFIETDPDIRSGICMTSKGATGFVVGDHLIATAAHTCVTKTDTANVWEDNLDVRFPFYGQIVSSSPVAHAVEVHIDKYFRDYHFNSSLDPDNPTPYTENEAIHDYALITVSEDLSDRYHFPLGIAYNAYNSDDFATYELYISGFPASDVNFPSKTLYTACDHLYIPDIPLSTSVLRYTTDAVSGNSGSPVYVFEDYTAGGNTTNYLTPVVAIHVAQNHIVQDNIDYYYNYGAFITPIMLKFYYNNNYISY